MKRVLPNLLTILAAAGVSFLVTRWTSPAASTQRSAQPPARAVASPNATFAPAPPRRHATAYAEEQTPSGPLDERSNEERVAEFRRGLDERFASAPRNGAWANKFEDVLRAELLSGQERFPHAPQAAVSCGLGICQLRLAHPDVASAQRFQNALLSGEFLNRPELLNQDNGCNLHAFSGEGEAPEDTFYVECREGRR